MAKRKKTADSPIAEHAAHPHSANSHSLAAPDLPGAGGGRRKKSASTRIGRACDRCQHRKLACQPDPEGCPQCQKVNAWCTVTDPLTGTPTYRGEFEYLERKVSDQNRDIQELVSRLKALGEDTSAFEQDNRDDKKYHAWLLVKETGDTRPWDRDEKQPNVQRHLGPQPLPNGALTAGHVNASSTLDLALPLDAQSNNGALRLPDVRTGFANLDDHRYVGIAPRGSSSKHKNGTKLNMLGWQIDLARFTDGDLDETAEPLKEALYDRSYRSFVASANGWNPKISPPDLPPKEKAIECATNYINFVAPFAPLYHGPTFIQLISRFYDDPSFTPSAADKAAVHAVIAMMLFQGAIRNFEEKNRAPDHARSDQHYHYALSFYAQLLMGNTLQDVQALGLIAVHVRNFPKPEIGWTAATATFSKSIQLGFHRSAKSTSTHRIGKTFREIEIQKRVFYSILMVLVTASGKLGRPMPIRPEDFDVEVPSAIPDEQLLETTVDTSKGGHCNFLIGVEGHKVVSIFLELYSVMYATKRSSKEYMQFVGIAERRIKAWEDQWPASFQQAPEKADPLSRIFIQYLHFWSQEFRILLHHPSLTLTKSFQFNDNNLRSCLRTSRAMLNTAHTLQEMKSLDTTWYNCAVYMLAIHTTFYGYDQLKEELTRAKLDELRTDMDTWVSIMGDIGGLLGSGRRLQEVIRQQTKIGLAQLENHLAVREKEEEEKAQAMVLKEPKMEPSTPTLGRALESVSGPGQYPTYPDPQHATNGYHAQQHAFSTASNTQSIHAFSPQVSYGGYNAAPGPAYSTSHGGYNHPYPINIATQALSSGYGPHSHSSATPNMNGSQNISGIYEATGNNFATNQPYTADSDSWQHYTHAQGLLSGVGPQDYQPAASALLQLGRPADHNMGAGIPTMTGEYDTSGMSGGAGSMWPLGVIEDNQGNQ